ncbi:GntP family permease [Aporhodopirellula aestuarii]|uniref:GntP family permease n=1 Tax=Aporhodopirellula aestuarii TaxID=2950107 RepID=A0ABT0TX37_9BACT|nr:SLC13 family permease [Aporhodopirellula aestuarii]MCM2369172.1 GntP family permease [Aporhodopirellula aestuarii]
MQLFILFSCVVLLLLSISRWNVHPFLALLAVGLLYGIGSGLGGLESVDLLMEGFAKTLQWIGVIMVLGAMIGEIANETGGAERIAKSTLKLAGEKRLPYAMGLTGYIISIPVFVDVAYIMMQTVTEALAAKSKQNILGVGLSLATGLTATHALMPPTPGPLAVAGILEGQLGRIILINFFVAFSAMAGGLAWAMFYCRRIELPYDRELRNQFASSNDNALAENDDRPKQTSGSTWLAMLPIFVPLVLIAISSFIGTDNAGPASITMKFLGTPLVALSIGVILALAQYGRNFRMSNISNVAERAIEKAALVIMITGAGGAFGHIIKNSGVTETISAYASDLGAFGFLFPFVLASIFTTTTGSITVSMITTASIVAPLMSSLGISPEMTAALIGSGSFCVFHVNSSFFWLLNRLHHAPPSVLLKTFTVQSLCMGLGGLAAVLVLRMCGLK